MIDKPLAPIQSSIEVYFTDGQKIGRAKITFGFGRIPTEKEVVERVKKFRDEELKEYSEQYHLMTSEEFFDEIMRQKTALDEKFATPKEFMSYSSDL